MLSANAQLDIRTLPAAALNPNFNQRSYPLAVDRHKRIPDIDFSIGVPVQKATSIISTDSQRGLCQIIGAKGKLGLGSEIICADSSPGVIPPWYRPDS